MESVAHVFLQLTDVSHVTNMLFIACQSFIELSKLAGSD